MTQKDHDHYLIKFVQNLKKYNNLDIEIPQVSTEAILKDPKQYAYNMVQVEFIKSIPNVMEAYTRGSEVSKANAGIIEKDGKAAYPDGEKVDPKLPPAYMIGNTINHPKQNCLNCKYWVQDYCAFWDPVAREEYWCKKWQKAE